MALKVAWANANETGCPYLRFDSSVLPEGIWLALGQKPPCHE